MPASMSASGAKELTVGKLLPIIYPGVRFIPPKLLAIPTRSAPTEFSFYVCPVRPPTSPLSDGRDVSSGRDFSPHLSDRYFALSLPVCPPYSARYPVAAGQWKATHGKRRWRERRGRDQERAVTSLIASRREKPCPPEKAALPATFSVRGPAPAPYVPGRAQSRDRMG